MVQLIDYGTTPTIFILVNMILGLLKPEMKILEDREPYYYFQSTNTTIAHHPMVTDIFEVVMFMLLYR